MCVCTIRFRTHLLRAFAGTYRVLSKGTVACPSGLEIETITECESALKQLGLNHSNNWNGSVSTIPRQCSHGTGHDMIWNRAPTGQGRADIRPICKAGVHVSQPEFANCSLGTQ